MKRRDFVKTVTASLATGASAAAAGSTSAATPESTATNRKPRIMFFHDSRHPAIYMYEPPMEKEEFESAVDELAGTSVEVLNF